jgi:hypothetical protein
MRYVVVLLGSGLVFAQSPTATPQKTLLVGKVLNSVTGEPVRKASVSLLSADGAAPGGSALTDAAGKFEIADLTPGSYWLVVAREGLVPPNQDGKLKRERVTIAAGEEKRDVIVRLVPLSFITGRIVDEDGEPLRRLTVEAMVYRYTASGRQLASRGEGSTNDLGEYRIFDLNPGRYYLKAGSTKPVYGDETLGPAYFPGTPDAAAASPIELGAGQPAEGIDLTLHPSKVAHIRGRVINPGNNLTVGLYHITGNGSGTSSSSVDDPKGKFELPDVAPGSYTLLAEATIGGQHCGAHLAIQVGSADLEGIELHLLPPVDIAGQIRIEGKTNARMSRLGVWLEDEGHMVQNMEGGEPKEDGSFAMEGLVPGIYQVSVKAEPDLYLKTVRWSDRDVMQSGLDLTQGAGGSGLVVVLSANGGHVDGVVQDDQAAPVERAMAVLVPSDAHRKKALLKVALTSHTGSFHMAGIAPGSYKLYAIDDADLNQVMYDPDLLKPFASQAESIEISEGSRKSVQLTLLKPAADQ